MQLNIRKVQDSVTPSLQGIMRSINSNGRRNVLLSAGREFLRITKNNFGAAGKYRDKQWPQLSPAYAKKVGHSNATLVGTGKLRDSIRMNAPRSNYVEIYTTNKYAAAIAFGNKKRNLPGRQWAPMQFSTPNYSRLVWSAERDLVFEIGKRLNILSNGALPRLSSMIQRSPFAYGNPFTGPQSSI